MEDIALEAQVNMTKAIENLKNSLGSLRTGRASAAMLNNIDVDYYGCPTPINQISSISIPEPRQLLIKPYSKEDVKAIITALNSSDLGLNPINEGAVIRLIIPALTGERRAEIVKQAHKYGEEAKVVIRNVRRDYMDLVKEDKDIPEDYQKRIEADIQKVTDEAIKNVDSIIDDKEKEITTL